MAVNLKGRSFLTLMDFSPEEVRYLLDLSRDLKAKKRSGVKGNLLFIDRMMNHDYHPSDHGRVASLSSTSSKRPAL